MGRSSGTPGTAELKMVADMAWKIVRFILDKKIFLYAFPRSVEVNTGLRRVSRNC